MHFFSTDIRNRAVILDIDGTLVPAGGREVPEDIAAGVESLKAHNDVFLLSNKNLPRRNAQVAQALGVPLVQSAFRKPDPRALRGLPLKHPLMVLGDKFLTDGLLAAFAGGEFVRVRRITGAAEPWPDRLFNAIDDIAWQAWHLARLLRPHQWTKNLIVFAPLFFSRHIFEPGALAAAAAAFFAFCFLASAGYVINDYMDRAADRAHARKRRRPIASGEVAPLPAFLCAALLAASAWLVLSLYAPQALWLALAYFASSFAYSIYLKKVPILEMGMFIWFYLARLLAGGAAAGVPLTAWLTLAVVFLALFFVVAKRYAQLVSGSIRKTLAHYPEKFLEGMLFVSAGLVVVFYAVYAILGAASPLAVYSTLPVLGGVMRYLQLAFERQGIENPERVLFTDPGLLAAGAAWFVAMLAVFY